MGLFDFIFRARTRAPQSPDAPMPDWFPPEIRALKDSGVFFVRAPLDERRMRDLWQLFRERWGEERPDQTGLLHARLATLDGKRVWTAPALLPQRGERQFAGWLEALADISDGQVAPRGVAEDWADPSTVQVSFRNGEQPASFEVSAADPAAVLAALIGSAQVAEGRFLRVNAGDDGTHIIWLLPYEKRAVEIMGVALSMV